MDPGEKVLSAGVAVLSRSEVCEWVSFGMQVSWQPVGESREACAQMPRLLPKAGWVRGYGH